MRRCATEAIMRIGANVFVLLAALLCLLNGAQGLTVRNPSCDRINCPDDSYDFDGFAYEVSQVK